MLDLTSVHSELALYYPSIGRPSIDPEFMIRCRMNAGTSRIHVSTGRAGQGFSDTYRRACERIVADPKTPKTVYKIVGNAGGVLLWSTLAIIALILALGVVRGVIDKGGLVPTASLGELLFPGNGVHTGTTAVCCAGSLKFSGWDCPASGREPRLHPPAIAGYNL